MNNKISKMKLIGLSCLILILLSFVILPPLFRTFIKDKAKEKPANIEEKKENIETKTLICNKEIETKEGELDIELEDFYRILYTSNKIKSANYTLEQTYKDKSDIITNLLTVKKASCNASNLHLIKSQIKGYMKNCDVVENSIITNENYEIERFEEQTYKDLNGTVHLLRPWFKETQKIEEIKKDLESKGYVCR